MIKFYKRLQFEGGDIRLYETHIQFYRKQGGCLNDKENRNPIAFKTIRIHTTL